MAMRIHELIHQTPNDRLLVERDVRSPLVVAELIAGLANTYGGLLIFGVDGQDVVGLRNTPRALAVLNRAIELVTPSLLIEPQVIDADGKNILVVDVPQGYNAPYLTTDGRILVLRDARLVPADAAHAAELAQRALTAATLMPLLVPSGSQRLQPKSTATTVDLEQILQKLERLIVANSDLTRKLDESSSWRSRLTDQLVGAVLGVVVSSIVWYVLGIG